MARSLEPGGAQQSAALAGLQSQIDQLSVQVNDLANNTGNLSTDYGWTQQSLQHFQNTNANVGKGSAAGGGFTGSGTSTQPIALRGGTSIYPVSAVKAVVLGNLGAQTKVSVTFLEPPDARFSIDHYAVYLQHSINGQTQEVLACNTHISPAVFTFQGDGSTAQVKIQTVLKNGQALAIPDCPGTSVIGLVFPGAWQTAALGNSWVANAGNGSTPQYRLDSGDVVRLRGNAKSGTITNGTTIFTLASGFRPPASVWLVVPTTTTTTLPAAQGDLLITSAGAVQCYGFPAATTAFSMDGLTFTTT